MLSTIIVTFDLIKYLRKSNILSYSITVVAIIKQLQLDKRTLKETSRDSVQTRKILYFEILCEIAYASNAMLH